jgi:ubiquinol-cytochrome c reductase cytochrome b subunit
VLTYFVVIFLAGSQDVIASKTGLSVQAIVWTLRTAVFVLPLATGAVAWSWCRGLAAGSREAEREMDEASPDIAPVEADYEPEAERRARSGEEQAASSERSASSPPADERSGGGRARAWALRVASAFAVVVALLAERRSKSRAG